MSDRWEKWSPFWQGFWLGWTGAFGLLSLRKYRKGEHYDMGEGMSIRIAEDWTLRNSIRWRWKLWFRGRSMSKIP